MRIFYLKTAGFWLVASLALAGNPALAAEPKKPAKATSAPAKAVSIVKWVDEKGITHYGDSIPTQYSGRDNSELDQQGRVIKRNKAIDSRAIKAEEEAKLNVEQRRRDKALVAAYTSEQEFDLARDRNMQTDEAAIEGLNQHMISAKERLAVSKKTADGFSRRKKPVPPYIAQDLKDHQDEVTKIEAQIAERQQSMEATRQRFEKDKQRFIQLKLNPNAPPPPETAAPVAAPAPSPALEAAEPAPAAPAVTPPKPVAATAPMAAPKAPTAKLAPTAPTPAKPAAAPTAPVPAAPTAATPAQPAAPVVTKPMSPAENTMAAPPAPATPATKPAAAATAKPVKKIKRVVMP